MLYHVVRGLVPIPYYKVKLLYQVRTSPVLVDNVPPSDDVHLHNARFMTPGLLGFRPSVGGFGHNCDFWPQLCSAQSREILASLGTPLLTLGIHLLPLPTLVTISEQFLPNP